MLSRTTKLVLAVIVVIGAGLYWVLDTRSRSEPDVLPEDAYPPGRWHRARVTRAAGDEDLDRLLSLPYLQGKVEAGETVGVVTYDREAAQAGLNLYCSGHAPEAVLMDMDGKILHRWRLDFDALFPDSARDEGSNYFRRVALLPEGDLLVLFQGWGLTRIDRDSEVRWVRAAPAFNDFQVLRDGRILVLEKEATLEPEIDPSQPVLEDFVVELSSDGEELRRWSLLELFRQSDYSGLLATMGTHADILHSNTVTLLEDSPFTSGPFQPDRLLVSLREVDVIGVVDPAAEEVVWAARGDWRRQHEPVLLTSGRVLLFDNQGATTGGARAIEIEAETGEIAWSWGDHDGGEIFSPEGGSVARLPNGNTLITASESGRAIEVDPEGTVVWEFVSPHRAGPNDSLVASLWELLRLEPQAVDWLVRSDD